MTIELAAPTAETVFAAVSFLPPRERIKLAGLLISAVSPRDIVDESDVWSDEDLQDFSDASFALIDERLSEEENASR